MVIALPSGQAQHGLSSVETVPVDGSASKNGTESAVLLPTRSKPSTWSALRFVHTVVDTTSNGLVPVAMAVVIWPAFVMLAFNVPFCFHRASSPAPTWSQSTGGSVPSLVLISSFFAVVLPLRKPTEPFKSFSSSSSFTKSGTGLMASKLAVVLAGKVAIVIYPTHADYSAVCN